jgi:anthranilate/para-aminobenzoate synthase component I
VRTQGITRTRKMAGIDSARVFEKAKSQGLDCFYLETSVGINESLSTTVIGFGPFKTLRNFSNKTEISFRDQVDISEEPFFSILDREVNKLQVRQDSGSQSEFEKNGGICRFQNGGIFGCIGYECVSEIEPRLLKFGTFKSNSCASKDSSASLPRAQLMICYKLIVFEAKMDLIYSIDATGARDSTCLPLFDQLLDSEEAPPPHKQGTMEFDTRNLDLPKDSLESGFGDVEFSKKWAKSRLTFELAISFKRCFPSALPTI